MSSDTRQRILQAARELFAEQGVQRTSLREIADRLGITKPALYYHFSSREDLVRSIVQPLIDGGEQFMRAQEALLPHLDRRRLLEGYFDFHYRHRKETTLILTELTTLADLGLIEMVVTWRQRLGALLVGPDPSLADAAKAVVALGGLQDCTIQFPDAPQDELRKAGVDAACAALGIS